MHLRCCRFRASDQRCRAAGAAKLGGKHGRIASWFAGWFNLLGQIAITSSVAMAATNSIIIMAVMASCPSKLNRYGGYSLDTIGAIHLGPSIPGYSRPEPCPFDGNHRPVLAQWAYVNATDGNTYYNGADGINDAGTQVFDIAAFPHHTVAYSDTECTRQPFNPTQPQVFGIFVGVMVCYGFINSVSIKAMDSMLKASIFIHIFGSLAIIIGLPIAAQVHQKKGLIWTRFQQGNWGASYGHGVTDSPYSSIFSGYLANDNLNLGGNGISATTDLQAGPHMFNVGMVTDSSSTTTSGGEPIFPINCDGHAPGSHNTGCIVRATYHQNFLHETNKHPGSGMSSANPYIFFCGARRCRRCAPLPPPQLRADCVAPFACRHAHVAVVVHGLRRIGAHGGGDAERRRRRAAGPVPRADAERRVRLRVHHVHHLVHPGLSQQLLRPAGAELQCVRAAAASVSPARKLTRAYQ